jgi:transposase
VIANSNRWLYAKIRPLLTGSSVLKAQRNKTDKNDARGLAQYIRMGGDYIRPVIVKNAIAQEDRMLLTLRQKYVSQKVAIENSITGVLKPLGITVPRRCGSATSFCNAFTETIAKAENLGPTLREAVLDSIEAYRAVNQMLENVTKMITRCGSAWLLPPNRRPRLTPPSTP